MKLYAETAPVRTRQLVADALLVVWTYVWIRAAVATHRAIERLTAPGRTLQSTGDHIRQSFSDAADKAHSVPLVGDTLSSPLRAASRAGSSLAAAGVEQQHAVDKAALALALVVVLVPVLLALSRWLPWRLTWVREATAGARLRDRAVDLDLFAVRALSHRSLPELARAGAGDLAAAYVRGDDGARVRLAALELGALGLRPPTAAVSPPSR